MTIEEKFKQAIRAANHIVVTTHIFPDADGIGGQIALCMALRRLGKKATCINEEKLLERYNYLDQEKTVQGMQEYKSNSPMEKIDLLIVVDTHSVNRIGAQMSNLAHQAKNILFIDHHPTSNAIKALHCIDTSAAATGEIVGYLIQTLGLKFDHHMALPLYTAIVIDTSSFRYPNVSGRTHRLIGDLLETGVRPPEAYNAIYGTKKLAYMHLLGHILSSAELNKTKEIAWITVEQKFLDQFKIDIEDTHAFINHLLILDNLKVACMFRDMGDVIKVSLRSSGDIDVGAMAEGLGGGGHHHSAAAMIKGELKSTIQETVKKLESILKLGP